MTLIGRNPEQKRLRDAFASHESEFVAVYGRRRVGKTFLIRQTLADAPTFFEVVGVDVGAEQLVPARRSQPADLHQHLHRQSERLQKSHASPLSNRDYALRFERDPGALK